MIRGHINENKNKRNTHNSLEAHEELTVLLDPLSDYIIPQVLSGGDQQGREVWGAVRIIGECVVVNDVNLREFDRLAEDWFETRANVHTGVGAESSVGGPVLVRYKATLRVPLRYWSRLSLLLVFLLVVVFIVAFVSVASVKIAVAIVTVVFTFARDENNLDR